MVLTCAEASCDAGDRSLRRGQRLLPFLLPMLELLRALGVVWRVEGPVQRPAGRRIHDLKDTNELE